MNETQVFNHVVIISLHFYSELYLQYKKEKVHGKACFRNGYAIKFYFVK
jgi:hypothetical protein